MKYWVLLGRILYSVIFVVASISHFSNETINYAAAQGVPLARLVVPAAGIMAFLGGISIAMGYKTRWGSRMLILFLIPVTLMMHNFWAAKDPIMFQIQMTMFLKNVSMLGGAFLISYFGPGPLSVDALIADGLIPSPSEDDERAIA